MLGHSDRAQEPVDRALAIAESTDDDLLRLRREATGFLAMTGATIGRPPTRPRIPERPRGGRDLPLSAATR